MLNVIKYIEGNFYYYLSKIGLGYDPIEKISQKRETICGGCTYNSKELNKCNECGCFLHLKTRVLDEECPKGKW